jgi:uracil-DNA glycosylase family 4
MTWDRRPFKTEILQSKKAMLDSHLAFWNKCQRCEIHRNGKGYLDISNASMQKVDILFIGEAPGKLDVEAETPLVSDGGLLFRRAISEANPMSLSYMVTTAVACRPTTAVKNGNKYTRNPNQIEVRNCHNRIPELLAIIKPNVLVGLGAIAKQTIERTILDEDFDGPVFILEHPTLVLRKGGVTSAQYANMVTQLREVFSEAMRLK